MLRLLYFLLILCFIMTLAPLERAASAPLLSAGDLIAAVNALRAGQGLQAYQADSWLMSYAQQHAEYCASLGHGTHQHSDGSYPWDSGIQENVASGTEGLLTIELVVYTIWSDWGHWKTMVGYATGQAGAGMVVKDGMVYYVLNVRPGEEPGYTAPEPTATGSLTAPATAAAGASATPAPYTFVPILTNTPQLDGLIVHIVRAGETLWSIALSYGVKVEEIRWLNGLPSDSNDIYLEQRLLIRPGNTETPTPKGGVGITPKPTHPKATVTATPLHTPTPPLQTSTSTAVWAASPTAAPLLPTALDVRSLGIGVLVGILILTAVGFNEFRRMRKR